MHNDSNDKNVKKGGGLNIKKKRGHLTMYQRKKREENITALEWLKNNENVWEGHTHPLRGKNRRNHQINLHRWITNSRTIRCKWGGGGEPWDNVEQRVGKHHSMGKGAIAYSDSQLETCKNETLTEQKNNMGRGPVGLSTGEKEKKKKGVRTLKVIWGGNQYKIKSGKGNN